MADKEFNSKGDRINSHDDGGYTCRVDRDRGTCTNNRTGESVNVCRNNDNSWSIDTNNTGNRNIFGNDYPSNSRDYDSIGSLGNSGGIWSKNDYPSSSNGRGKGGYSGGSSLNSGPSGYISNSGQYCGNYAEKYAADVSNALVKMHGSKPSLVLGFNPSILTH